MIKGLSDWIQYLFGANTLDEYIRALILFLILALFMKLLAIWFIKVKNKVELRTQKESFAGTIVEPLKFPFFIVVSLFIATRTLNMTDIVGKIINYIIVVGLIFYLVKVVNNIITYIIHKIQKSKELDDSDRDSTVIIVFGRMIKAFIWFLAFLWVLNLFGINVSGLLAGAGIAGIAIAFALQNVLSDIFASVSIYFDKPFKHGDFIRIGDDSGTVQKIGMKSTRIKTLQGEELVISNKELTESRVRNFKKMKKRRVNFAIGIEYGTPKKKLEKIPVIVKKVISKIDNVEFERAHFKSYGDFSLNFEIVYTINSRDYELFMDIQEEINYGLYSEFEKAKISMAFPTQTLHIASHKNK